MDIENMVIENRQARYNYHILETLGCGIELKGHEVKSIKKGSVSLTDAWCRVTDANELIVSGMHVTKGNNVIDFHIDEKRDRRLLAHKREIIKLKKEMAEDGVSIIPLQIYFSKGKCKMLIGICKGKHNYDKRNALKEKDIRRRIERNTEEYSNNRDREEG